MWRIGCGDLEMCRCRDVELWICRCGDVDVWILDVEMWRCGDV